MAIKDSQRALDKLLLHYNRQHKACAGEFEHMLFDMPQKGPPCWAVIPGAALEALWTALGLNSLEELRVWEDAPERKQEDWMNAVKSAIVFCNRQEASKR